MSLGFVNSSRPQRARPDQPPRDAPIERAAQRPTVCEYYKHPPLAIVSISSTAISTFVLVHKSTLGLTIPNQDNLENVWRYVTLLFAHNSLWHLVGNVIFLVAIGIPLEALHGSLRVVLLFFWGGIVGGVSQVLLMPPSETDYVLFTGASPGVYSIAAAQAANLVLNFHIMPYRWWRAIAIVAFVVSDAVVIAYDEEQRSTTAYFSHIFGAVAGLFLGLGILHNLDRRVAYRNVQKCSRVVLVIGSVSLVAVRLGRY